MMWFHNWFVAASSNEIWVAFVALLVVCGSLSGIVNVAKK